MNRDELTQLQGLDLEIKVLKTQQRIREWYEYNQGQVYVSFSGGKDSTVLLHLVRELYPDVVAVFADTGLEYPEIKDFVRSVDNVITVKPDMGFKQVLDTYGYPVISKMTARKISDLQNPKPTNAKSRHLYLTGERSDGTMCKSYKLAEKWKKLIDAPFKVSSKCCDIMKKNPLTKFERKAKLKPFIGTMAQDSSIRSESYRLHGCNNHKGGKSQPMGFWLEKDVWEYIRTRNLQYSQIYDMGESRTGCIFCLFGCHLEEKDNNRFVRMKKSHPKLHKYCMERLGLKEVLDYIGVRSE